MIDTRPYLWLVNIGSGNGLVPSGNKPLPEPMLTQIYVVSRPQWVNAFILYTFSVRLPINTYHYICSKGLCQEIKASDVLSGFKAKDATAIKTWQLAENSTVMEIDVRAVV